MKTIKHYNELAKQYNKIKKDEDRLVFLKNHNEDMTVVLDNDYTMVNFLIPSDLDESLQELIGDIAVNLKSFDKYHGNSTGVFELFKFAGINAEHC